MTLTNHGLTKISTGIGAYLFMVCGGGKAENYRLEAKIFEIEV